MLRKGLVYFIQGTSLLAKETLEMALLFEICGLFHILLFTLFSVVFCQDCGRVSSRQGETQFFVGIVNTTTKAWPWMVPVLKRHDWGEELLCTGFLIDRDHLVTAAQCFADVKASLYFTRTGYVHPLRGSVNNFSRIAIPESYKRGKVYDDIAVVTLAEKVSIRNFSPLCLPKAGELRNLTGKGATMVGWGSTRPDDPAGGPLKQLSAIPILSNSECENLYIELPGYNREFFRGVSSGILCAGFVDASRRNTCRGSAGGPLMIKEGNTWYVVGINAFGYICGQPGFPDIYTRVSEYLDFINENRN